MPDRPECVTLRQCSVLTGSSVRARTRRRTVRRSAGGVHGDLASLCGASRNVFVHYRAELPDLPEERRGEIDSRWLEAILALDRHRTPSALTRLRPAVERVAGCCRDH